MNIRIFFICAALGILAAYSSPLFAQNKAKDDDEGRKFPSKGVRFVICSPTGERLPSPLYAKVGESYAPINISPRMPSPRLAPNAKGLIQFYESDPGPKPKEQPRLSIEVPQEHRNKSVCVVQPNPNREAAPTTYFLNERDFAKGGVYIVNLSSSTLEIVTSTTGEFRGEEKRAKIAPGSANRKNISIDSDNVWNYKSNKKNGKVYYALSALNPTPNMPDIRIKSSVFMTMDKQSQVSFIVDDPAARRGVYRFMSIQFGDPPKASDMKMPTGPFTPIRDTVDIP